MGFFGDLKQDLSQAVNELLPEEEKVEVVETETVKQEEVVVDDFLAKAQQAFDSLTEGALDEQVVENEENLTVDADKAIEDEIAAAIAVVTEEEIAVEEQVETEAEKSAFEVAVEDVMDAGVALAEEIADILTSDAQEEISEEPAVDEAALELDKMLDEAIAGLDMSSVAALEEPAAQEAEQEIEEAVTPVAAPVKEESEEKNNTLFKGVGTKMDNYREMSDETSVITKGMIINGDIDTDGNLDLVGAVNGNLVVTGKLNITGFITGNSNAKEIFAENAKITGDVVSEGAVKIGAGTVIVGNISATSAAIAGAVKGDIDVHGPVILDSSAIVMGNIKSKSVQINNGAAIEGLCSQCYADVSPTSFFDDYKPEKR